MLSIRFVLSTIKLSRKMSVFTQHPNPITGITTWEEQDENYDYHQEVARSAFADMLHDHERNEKYYLALKAAIEKMHKKGKLANVLDIGTGTGLLSMMAAKCGADSIVACEAFRPMATCAAKIIEQNGFEDKIKLIYKRSQNLTVGEDGDLKQKANILVTEVFDTELIGEGALSTFKHASEQLLEEDCIVVPSKGTVWAQIIDSETVRRWNKISPIKNPITDQVLLDSSSLTQCCTGAAAVHDIQLSQLSTDCFTPLTSAQVVFKFDWTGKQPLIFDQVNKIRTVALNSGTAHAVFMWWDLDMDTEGKILLSCAPVWEHPDVKFASKEGPVDYQKLADKIPWRDHWMQAIYYLPKEIQIEAKDEVELVGSHDEYSFWFHVLNKSKNHNEEQFDKPVCECCIHVAYSRTRIGQLSDKTRNDNFIRSLSKTIKSDSTCLCISDGSFLGLTAIKLGAKKVYMLETNYLSRRTMENCIASNGLEDRVKVVDSIEKLPVEQIDLIFGEPYFVTSILPWGNLRFWYLASKFPKSVTRIPKKLAIKAVPVQFKDLHKIRAPLGICEGFDLRIFDELVEDSSEKTDSTVEAQPLWEYPATALSKDFTITELDLTQDINSLNTLNISKSIEFEKDGLCNGVAIWIDWQLIDDITISTGPLHKIVPGRRISWDPYTRQGVHLLRKIRDVKKGDLLNWSFTFVPKDGLLQFNFKIS